MNLNDIWITVCPVKHPAPCVDSISESRMLPGPSVLRKSTSAFHAFTCPTPHKKLHHLAFLLPQQKTPSTLFKCCAPSGKNSTKRGIYIFLPPDGFVLPKKFSQSLSSHGSQVISLKQKSQVISRLSLSQSTYTTNATRCIPAVMPSSVGQRWSKQHLFHYQSAFHKMKNPGGTVDLYTRLVL